MSNNDVNNMTDFVMLPQYKQAIKSIRDKQITFISGGGGCGKSTFIKYIKSKVKKCIILAPTGIASVNVGGRTIHSFCGFPPTSFILPDDIKRKNQDIRKFIRDTDLIIVDEISMVSSNMLDAFNEFIQLNTNDTRPFGGIHILFVGDLFQLPPVIKDDVVDIYDEYYPSHMFYGSNVIREAIENDTFNCVIFDTIMRQKDDVFVKILNNIRVGNNVEKSIEVLNRLTKKADVAPDGYVQITPYNEVSDETNRLKLDKIDSPIKVYYGSIIGKFNEKNVIVPQALKLKIGAQVMVCKNVNGLINGMVGKVVALKDSSVDVDINGKIHNIEPTTWEEYGFVFKNNNYSSSVVGEYKQIPLKLAWSMTIHKVQSATIEKLYIDMSRGAFASGMLYVALSRATTIKGMLFSKNLNPDDVIVNQEVIDFYKNYI